MCHATLESGIKCRSGVRKLLNYSKVAVRKWMKKLLNLNKRRCVELEHTSALTVRANTTNKLKITES